MDRLERARSGLARIADELELGRSVKRGRNLFRALRRGRTPVGQTPAVLVHAENKWRLLRYRSSAPRRFETPIFLVPSLINRHYVLDLAPGRSFAEFLLERGHDVFIIDW
ncbi:MAG: class III poly(R)-hydroxyalkanoic acid synthase subunit PhaC, partial [Myxococcota bacterium]